jgi:hypothetical protein
MKITTSKRLALAIAVLMVIAVMSSSASAETLKTYVSRAGNLSSTNTHFFIALNAAGATSLAFSTTAPNTVMKITYNAECGVLGPSESWLSVTILVDGVQANPASGNYFALCSAESTTDWHWAGAVRQSTITVPSAGAHNVQVLVDLNGGATAWWLGDTWLGVEQQ